MKITMRTYINCFFLFGLGRKKKQKTVENKRPFSDVITSGKRNLEDTDYFLTGRRGFGWGLESAD